MLLWLVLNGLLLLLAYLLGAIPTGYWVGRVLKGIDIREHGSGSTGATNVLRTVGKLPALFVFVVDVGKGAVAIAILRLVYTLSAVTDLANSVQTSNFPAVDLPIWLPWMVTLAGIVALLGHSKSLFLKFTGGKSVATSLGILLSMSWVVGLGTFGVFLLMLAISRIVSLSSIAGAIAVSGLMVATGQPLPYLIFGLAGGLYVILRHRANIQRLLEGTEPRIGQKLPETPPSAG